MKLSEIIKDFTGSMAFKWYMWGEDYYKSDNTAITERVKQYYDTTYNKLMCDPYKANHKLASGFFKKIVDQKVQYLLGNGLTSEYKDDLDTLTGDIDEMLVDMGTTASKKKTAWSYLFKENGKDKLVQVPTEQIIPYYDSKGMLIMLIRFYLTTEKIEDELTEVHKAEFWTPESVTIYVKKEKEYHKERELPHYTSNVNLNGATQEEKPNSWGFVPFFPLYNNKEHISDLKCIKDFIDIFDVIDSDFANNIDDMQDAYYILKNFQGQDLPEFLSQLKKDKVVQVGEDGDLEAKQLEIPTEARKVFLGLTREQIFEYSMAVDVKGMTGGQITNIMVQAQYTDLDLKTDQFETQVQKFLKAILAVIKPEAKPDFTFERSLIINRIEIMTILKDLGIKISNLTLLKNAPFVEDAEEEETLLDGEQKKIMDSIDNNMDFEE